MYSRFLLFLLLAHLNDAKKSGAHRYWRLQAPGTTKWGVLEVRWLDAESGEAVVPGSDAAVLSSGSHAAWCSGSAAADGDDKSYWLESKAESEDRWIGVDFGEGGGAEVGAAEVMQVAHDNYRAFFVELQWSDDGASWTYFKSGELDGTHRDPEVGGAYWEKVPAPPRLDFEGEAADFF